MSFETITPPIAHEMLSKNEGWTYLDVRTPQEFAANRAAGSINIPIATIAPGMGMVPNPNFIEEVRKHFQPSDKLVVACKMGGRSMKACEFLYGSGYTNIANMHGGFEGARDESGQISEKGWADCGFPTESGQ